MGAGVDFSYNSEELANTADTIKQQGEKVDANLEEMKNALFNKLARDGITGETAEKIKQKFEHEYLPKNQAFAEEIGNYGTKTQKVSEASAELTEKNNRILG